jgi:acyl-CoA synthetase (AMP-forming)/AMP-acid ligase II
MIISSENIYSVDFENAIAQHPAVAQCAVIVIPNDQWGDRFTPWSFPGVARRSRTSN